MQIETLKRANSLLKEITELKRKATDIFKFSDCVCVQFSVKGEGKTDTVTVGASDDMFPQAIFAHAKEIVTDRIKEIEKEFEGI